MSSLFRNVSKSQRSYKERSQPKERTKWGILEKHKDYSLRAKDYNEKKRRLKVLRQKASERNPDEFHFAMMNSKTNDTGRKTSDRGNHALSHDVVKLLKTQDVGYLRNSAQRTRRLRQRHEQEFVLQGESTGSVPPRVQHSGRQHIQFADSVAQQQPRGFDRTMNSTMEQATRGRPSLTTAVQGSDDMEFDAMADAYNHIDHSSESERKVRVARKKRKREAAARSNRLDILKQREQDLLKAEEELNAQRNRIAHRTGGMNGAGVKWKRRERQR